MDIENAAVVVLILLDNDFLWLGVLERNLPC